MRVLGLSISSLLSGFLFWRSFRLPRKAMPQLRDLQQAEGRLDLSIQQQTCCPQTPSTKPGNGQSESSLVEMWYEMNVGDFVSVQPTQDPLARPVPILTPSTKNLVLSNLIPTRRLCRRVQNLCLDFFILSSLDMIWVFFIGCCSVVI